MLQDNANTYDKYVPLAANTNSDVENRFYTQAIAQTVCSINNVQKEKK